MPILIRTLLLVIVAALALGTGTALAASAKRPAPSWKTLINDWYDGRIDGTYAIHCYREALRHLPTDVDTYSSARDDIKQALQERITQSHRKNGNGTPGGGTTTGGGGTGSGTGGGSGTNPPGSGSGGSGANPPGSGGGKSAGGPIGNVFDATRPGKADSVPVPLIVLGGVAVALMGAGGVGFLARRNRTRRLQLASAASLPQGSPEPPAPKP
jgi:hypothetical protein